MLNPIVQSEIHYHIQDHIQEQILKHEISSTTEKIIQLNRRLLLGESNLFDYDPTSHAIVLSLPFRNLLELLVQLDELNCKALTAKSLYDLNLILQQHQGFQGGLLRKEATERWHLDDNPTKQKHYQTFDALLQELGFVLSKSVDCEMPIDHCIIFGGRAERMETRIIETLDYLKNLKATGHIFLLGSNRKLIQPEIDHLKPKLEKLDESQIIYWNEVFNDPEQSTEANAFVFLWKCIVPQEMQTLLEDKLISIKSTRIGNSYNGQQGHRVTTEVTVEDLLAFCEKTVEPKVIFAVAGKPYIRLADQLRFTVLSKGKKAKTDELIERIKNITFYFASPNSNSSPLISVILDEIGRNVYRTVDTLKYLESLEQINFMFK
jgi:hypothetical protein